MKKHILSIICLALSGIMLFGACTRNKEDSQDSGSHVNSSNGDNSSMEELGEYINGGYGTPSLSSISYDLEADVEGTTHVFNVGTTNYKIVEKGKSDYKILLPKNANDFEEDAAKELQYFFREATGISLPIETEGEVFISGTKYLSIGNTSLRDACGTSFDYDTLGYNGYKIDTYNQSVIMSGFGKQGTLYAVYEFLHQAFNWETYGPDCIVYDKGVKELALSDYNITDVPDIPWRQVTSGLLTDMTYSRRLRYNNVNEIMGYPGGWCHNTFHAVKPEIYLAEHPDWYARDKEGNIIGGELVSSQIGNGQICYTCDDPELLEVAANSLIAWLEESPDVENIMFSHQDTNDWCECADCTESYLKYGTHAAAVIQFVNKLRRKLDPWCEETGRNIVLSFFAYLQTEDAPVKLENGKYVPIDETVVCDDGVGVMYAPIGADYSKSFSDPSNSAEYNNFSKWGVLSNKLYLWSYQTDFHSYLCPYNTFNSMQSIYKLAYLNNTFWILDQQQSYQNNCTAFNILKYYLASKLAWNVNVDLNELIDNFFENYFGLASKPMRQLFEELRARFSYIENDLNITMYIYVTLENKDFWPEGLLVQWLDYIEDAYKAIEAIKETDEDTYYLIKDRLLLEGISYRYLLIDLYGKTYYNETTLLAQKMQWKADCAYLGVNCQREGVDLVSWLAENWGV